MYLFGLRMLGDALYVFICIGSFGLRTLGDAIYVFIWNTDARWCSICIYLDDGGLVVQIYIYLDYGRLVVPGMFLFGIRTLGGAKYVFIWTTDAR